MKELSSSFSPPSPLEIVGEHLLLAIKRRGLKRQDVAERALISVPTLRAVLNGEPGTSIGAYAAVLEVLGLRGDLLCLADPLKDEVGIGLSHRYLPARVKTGGKYDI